MIFALLAQAAPAQDLITPQELVAETAETAETAEVVVEADGVSVEIVSEPAPEPVQPLELIVPKAHPILITIEGQVGSKISRRGQFFPIRLADPVIIDGVEVLPAGLEGEGQVVHAEKAGFAGSAGELILAARYLQYGDRRIDLRSFRFIEEGEEVSFRGADNTGAVAATVAVLGPLGFLIGGGNTTIEPGTLARAKIRNEEIFEVAAEPSPAADTVE